jgi:hypothetical protein
VRDVEQVGDLAHEVLFVGVELAVGDRPPATGIRPPRPSVPALKLLVDQRGELEVVGGEAGFLGGEAPSACRPSPSRPKRVAARVTDGRFRGGDGAVHAHHFQQQRRRRDLQRMLPRPPRRRCPGAMNWLKKSLMPSIMFLCPIVSVRRHSP